jgi:DNA invertase Pin-like site-specific DNA recombinase
MKYVIYLRVSTDHQVKSGLGLEAQRKICLKQVPNESQVLEFADEGYSGALAIEKRPGLIMALNSLCKNDVLLIAKRDRIGRDPIVNAMIERAVERKKAKLISASGDVRDDNDPTSILMRRMVDAFSEYERLLIGMRTKMALAVKKSRNQRVGHIPYGFKLKEDKIHLEEDPHEQYNLNIMSQMKLEGNSLRNIAEEMNFSNRLNRDGIWNHVSVGRVIKKPICL